MKLGGRSRPIVLATLAARVTGYQVKSSLGSSHDEGPGKSYLLVSLTIQNRTHSRRVFGYPTRQIALRMDGRLFWENIAELQISSAQSFAGGAGISPGATRRGQVVFVIPQNLGRMLPGSAGVVVSDFGLAISSSTRHVAFLPLGG